MKQFSSLLVLFAVGLLLFAGLALPSGKPPSPAVLADVVKHVPDMQNQLDRMTHADHSRIVEMIETSTEPHVILARPLLDLEYRGAAAFHGPTVPPDPNDAPPPVVLNCPGDAGCPGNVQPPPNPCGCAWWDFLCWLSCPF